jgi:Tfp pilus assembly protein PilF
MPASLESNLAHTPGRGSLVGLAGAAALTAAMLLCGSCTSEKPPETVHADGLYASGAMALQEGQTERAVTDLKAAVGENPNLIMARFLLGNIYRDQGDLPQAAEQYERVVELDPYSYTNHYNLALTQHLMNHLRQARDSYLRAIDLKPDDFKSNMNLGLVYAATGEGNLGVPYARHATEINPASPDAWANLGVVLDAAGHLVDADNAYRKAIELDSTRLEPQYNLAANLVTREKYYEAVAIYERIVQKSDTSMAHERYGSALQHAGRTADAITQLNIALKLNPRNFRALNALGDSSMAQYRDSIMLDEQKRAAAIDYWQRSLLINPEQPRIAEMVKKYATAGLFPK